LSFFSPLAISFDIPQSFILGYYSISLSISSPMCLFLFLSNSLYMLIMLSLINLFIYLSCFCNCKQCNNDIKSAGKWASSNTLHLDSSKSSLFIIDSSMLSRLNFVQFFDTFLNFVLIPRSSSIKIFNVHFDTLCLLNHTLGASRSGTAHWELSELSHLIDLYF